MGVPPLVDGPKPGIVGDAAWASRMMLPWVRSERECNVALLPVLKHRQGVWYTWTIDNLERIAQAEAHIAAGDGRDGVFRNCVIKGIGGFRQVAKRSGLIMVLYETDSDYERFLFSGRGASHYDAARELPDGTFQTAWIGVGPLLNSTQPSLLRGVNTSEPDEASSSGQLVSSRPRRSNKEDRRRA
ncbi:MAG: hypothetical protein Q9208_004803 [Pyrenodesmia sp. 3 TL-2023]